MFPTPSLPSFIAPSLVHLSSRRAPKPSLRPTMCQPQPSNPFPTAGAALRAWSHAQAPSASAPGRRRHVLFLDAHNRGLSVAMHAIFVDLVTRRGAALSASSAGAAVDASTPPSPDALFAEALLAKRGLDISTHAPVALRVEDLSASDIVVCCDESVRGRVLYAAQEEGEDGLEAKVVCITSFASQDRLKALRYRDGVYSRDQLNFVLAGLVDACTGLLASLLEGVEGE